MTVTTDDHAHLLALIGDAIRDGLDTARVHLPPRAERTVIERAVEHIECGHYTLTRPEPHAERRVTLDEKRQIFAERCERLLARWADEDASTIDVTAEREDR